MPRIFNVNEINYVKKETPIPEFNWTTSINLSELAGSKNLKFDIRILEPGKYSYPYHSHRNAEELFFIIEGEALLRTPEGIKKVSKGDVLYFEKGLSGAHQLCNNGENNCVYLDIRTTFGIDICDYPDSGKINILPEVEVFKKESQVDYFIDEENIKDKWNL